MQTMTKAAADFIKMTTHYYKKSKAAEVVGFAEYTDKAIARFETKHEARMEVETALGYTIAQLKGAIEIMAIVAEAQLKAEVAV